MSARTTLSSTLVKAANSSSRSNAVRKSHALLPQLSRQFATSIAASNSTHKQSTSHASSSFSSTASTASSSSSSSSGAATTPDASTLLLLNTLPHIPQYGFSKQAYVRSTPSSSSTQPLDPEELTKRMRIVSTLFPGPDSSFDSKLFQTWSHICDLSIIHSSSPDQIIHSLINGISLHPNTQHKPVRMQQSLNAAEESEAIQKVASLIQDRLRLSWAVKNHLMHGITALSTSSPTNSRLHSIFPHETVLPNLPNPTPLLNLTSGFVEAILTNAETQKRTGWIDSDGPNWYAVRGRLTLAYAAATLHAASPSVVSFQDTQRLFQRIVRARDTGLVATIGGLAQNGTEWIKWGGRGWLGVFRSLGL